MTENFIQLEKDDIVRLEIKTNDGKSTNEYLEFDLEDTEMLLRYQELLEKDKKNKQWIKNQFLIIEKRQDVKGKKLLSKNEEDKLVALNEFLKKEEEVYDMFLGENGVKKLLNGRKLSVASLQAIDKIISKQILPYLDISMEKITKKVKEQYSQTTSKEEIEVIE